MEQFSHDLTLALEETSRSGGVRAGRWGSRRRTRSTGNLRKYFILQLLVPFIRFHLCFVDLSTHIDFS